MSFQIVDTILQTVVPGLGAILSILKYASSLKKVNEAKKKGFLSELNIYPYVFQLYTSAGWLIWSCHLRNVYVLSTGLCGVLLALYYLFVTMRIAKQETFDKLTIFILSGLSSTLGLLIYISFFDVDFKTIENLTGMNANVWLLGLFSSPLTTLVQVIREKSSASLDFNLCLMIFSSAVMWCTYGAYMQVSELCTMNGVGVLLGFIQLFFIWFFPRENKTGLPLLMTVNTSINSKTWFSQRDYVFSFDDTLSNASDTDDESPCPNSVSNSSSSEDSVDDNTILVNKWLNRRNSYTGNTAGNYVNINFTRSLNSSSPKSMQSQK